ncbi:hypothetical protein [Longibacter sp.]|uniref:hypothetical protein n=1 Tax=Longibacter sp. TaxID=2045415 RepID=UPI003EBD0C51
MTRCKSVGRTAALAFLVAVVLTSCSLFGSEDGQVVGDADPPVLVIENETGQIAHFFTIAGPQGPFFDVAFGDYRSWPAIEPGKTREVPLTNVYFYDESSTYVWVRWKTRDREGSFEVSLP